MKEILKKIIFVVILMFLLSGSLASPAPQEMSFTVSGSQNVYYKDKFNQMVPIEDNEAYPGSTWIKIGESPKNIIDNGTRGYILFNGKYFLESEKDGKNFYAVEGPIFDLIFDKYFVEN